MVAPKPASKKAAVPCMSKTDKAGAEGLVRNVMSQQNRPFTAQLLSDHTAGRVKKQACQTILDGMVSEGVVVLKAFGKNAVYFANQLHVEAKEAKGGAADEAGGQSTEGQAALEARVTEASEKARKAAEEVAALKKTLSDELLAKEVADLQQAVAAKQKLLDQKFEDDRAKNREAKNGKRARKLTVSSPDKAKLNAAFVKTQSAWKRSRRTCTDILSIVCGYNACTPEDAFIQYGLDSSPTSPSSSNSASPDDSVDVPTHLRPSL